MQCNALEDGEKHVECHPSANKTKNKLERIKNDIKLSSQLSCMGCVLGLVLCEDRKKFIEICVCGDNSKVECVGDLKVSRFIFQLKLRQSKRIWKPSVFTSFVFTISVFL